MVKSVVRLTEEERAALTEVIGKSARHGERSRPSGPR